MIRVTLWECDAALKAGTIEYASLGQKGYAPPVLNPSGFVNEDLVQTIHSQLEENQSNGRAGRYDWSIDTCASPSKISGVLVYPLAGNPWTVCTQE